MEILLAISFLLFCLMLFIGFRVINGFPLIPSFLSKAKSLDPKTTLVKNPDPKAVGYCVFDNEDLYNKSIYDYEGKLIKQPQAPFTCDECTNYVYKDSDGNCSAMRVTGYTDDSKNSSKLCDDTKTKEENLGCIQAANVCNVTVSAAQICPFK